MDQRNMEDVKMNKLWSMIAALVLLLMVAANCTKTDDPNDGGNDGLVTDTIVNDTVVADGDSLVSHGVVDLGLPSGVLWAVCNLGAEAPEDLGDYYAWGETAVKDTYYWKDYRYGDFVDDRYAFTKYCTDMNYGLEGFVDYEMVLDSLDDAATACWGGEWRIPTKGEWEELFQNTTNAWFTQNGVDGWLFTAANGNSMFLPAAGFHWDDAYNYDGLGLYWSSTLNKEFPNRSWSFYFNAYQCHVCGSRDRNCGLVVRAVKFS